MQGNKIMTNAIKEMTKAEVMKAAFYVRNRLDDGSINWDFVDHDAFMAVSAVFGKSREVVDAFYEIFDVACELVEYKIANL